MPRLYFGYQVLRPTGGWPVLMADPEKALLDYCDPHPGLRTAADFIALRLTTDVLRDQLNFARLADYQTLFAHQRLNQRIRALLSLLWRVTGPFKDINQNERTTWPARFGSAPQNAGSF